MSHGATYLPSFWSLSITDAVYNLPDRELAEIPDDAIQTSPLIPGASSLEQQPDGSLSRVVMLAPPGVLERRFAIAHALRALATGGELLVLAPKDRGGARLRKELSSFGCDVTETSRRHHRICHAIKPSSPAGLDAAITEGGPSIPPDLGLWSQPGIFSWDRLDKGSAILLSLLPALKGAGADFGCGAGSLARFILQSPDVTRLLLVDIDRRAIEAARKNIPDERAAFFWHDLRADHAAFRGLDFIVMNPPFHDGGAEDRALGQAFIQRAAASLKPGGACWLVANRHLPYEMVLKQHFKQARQILQDGGYKVYEARRG